MAQLYHEAQRRAAKPQPCVRHTVPASVLLTAPNNIIFELFNTMVREMSGERLMEFVTRHLADYLATNWTNKITQRAIRRLKREQAVDQRAGVAGMPLIGGSPGEGRENGVKQVYEHLMWRIKSENVSQISSLLVKLALDDGLQRGKLKAQVYDDVASCLEDWRSSKLIKLYAFGNAPASDQRLILASTSGGDLTRWVANFIDGSEKGQNGDLLRKLAGALRDRTKNCFFITHELKDALSSIETGAIWAV